MACKMEMILEIMKQIAISFWLAIPIITLSGIQNGDDIGTIAAILFNSLVGFIIVKYDK